ncbi:MAG: PKD domain-containing protein [Agriterribacter sp.]
MRKNFQCTPAIFFFFLLLFCSQLVFAQQSVEFTENKGQWDHAVLFKGEITNGAFFLQKNGFTVLMHNEDDLHELLDHGHDREGSTAAINTSSRKAYPRPATGEQKDSSTAVLRSHAYNMSFVGGNANPEIVTEKAITSYENYFIGNDPSKWASNCKIYQAITYKNMYPGIDVRYYANGEQLKYDIIVQPGADAGKIVMRYEGADKLQIKNQELLIKTSVGDVKELSPYSYQVDDKGKKEINVKYVLENNTIKFKIKNYNSSQVLVIDPTLIFATFTGSRASQWGYTATYGADGSLYSGGIVFASGFPVSTGAFQTSFAGAGSGTEAVDMGIMKLNGSGRQRLYATYIGGNGADQPHSLIEDNEGNLVILGRTNSVVDGDKSYPLFPAGNKYGPCGGHDIVVTKLNASGTALIGSKRIGGAGADAVNIKTDRQGPSSLYVFYGDDSRSEVIVDGSNNIYIASCTQSTNFPTSTGASQSTLAGKQDGVLIKLAPDVNNILFSTLFGGSDDDGTFVLALNPLNSNIYVGGSTNSTNLPGIPSSGVVSSAHNGGTSDGFVAIFSSSGALQKATYIGTSRMDAIYGLKIDLKGFPYITGVTLGNWPVTPAGIYSNAGSKQFIVKLQQDLSATVYSTVYGSGALSYNISPVAFAVDKCENVYVSGWGGAARAGATDNFKTAGTTGMPTKNCSVLPNGCRTDGRDFYFFVLKKDAADILFGSFYGLYGGYVDHVDGGTSRFDQNGIIYQAICAACFIGGSGLRYPTTVGSWSPTSGAPDECNLAAVKIEMDFSGVTNGVRPSVDGIPYKTYGCVPLTVDFIDTLQKGTLYIWDFGDGNKDTTTTASSSNTYNHVGDYLVRLISVDSGKCIISDTSYTNIRVRQDKAELGVAYVKLPPCESLRYRFANTSVAPAGKPFKADSFTWDFGDGSSPVLAGLDSITHEFPAPGTYNVSLILTDTNYCNGPDTFKIVMRVAPNVKARFETNPDGCAPHLAEFNNTSEAGLHFYWSFGDGSPVVDEFSPTHEYTNPGSYTIKLVVVDSMTCNISDSVSQTINVWDSPTAGFTFSPISPQENMPATFTNTSLNAIRYRWLFGDGDTSNLINPTHQYNATATFDVALVAFNQYGCTDTAYAQVSAIVSPLIAVPSAFSPNGDGVNDKVYVRGFAIAKMMFRIYNRWGQVVFQTTDRNQGWDGKFKGALQPMDAYAYTLEVEFSDGTKATKKGDITLLR